IAGIETGLQAAALESASIVARIAVLEPIGQQEIDDLILWQTPVKIGAGGNTPQAESAERRVRAPTAPVRHKVIPLPMLLARYRPGNAAYRAQQKAEDCGIRIHLSAFVRAVSGPRRAAPVVPILRTQAEGGLEG